MLKELSSTEQADFDLRIIRVKEAPSRNWSLSQSIVDRIHYTNWIEILPYSQNRSALIKCPKRLTSIIYVLESVRRLCRRTHPNFSNITRKFQFEYETIRRLYQNGVTVPQPIYTSVDGVVVTEFLPHKDPIIDLGDEGYERFLQNLATALSKIHEFGMHGEFAIPNVFQHGGKSYVTDFERFVPTDNPKLLVQDLKRIIGSVASHTNREVKQIEEIIMGSYLHSEVRDLYFSQGR